MLSKAHRNLASVRLDEIQTCAYKATLDDPHVPKQKHVDALLRYAAQPQHARAVALAVAKRLHDKLAGEKAASRSAAKALALTHTLVTSEHAAVRAILTAEIATICHPSSEPRRRAPPAAERPIVEAFMRHLHLVSGWSDVGTFRAAGAAAAWRTLSIADALARLPRLQGLLRAALDAIAVPRGGDESEAALLLRRLLVEDALALYRSEAAAVAVLVDGLLGLAPQQVAATAAGAATAGAAELIEAFEQPVSTVEADEQQLGAAPRPHAPPTPSKQPPAPSQLAATPRPRALTQGVAAAAPTPMPTAPQPLPPLPLPHATIHSPLELEASAAVLLAAAFDVLQLSTPVGTADVRRSSLASPVQRDDEAVAGFFLVRTRLGISIRQQRRLVPLLFPSSDDPSYGLLQVPQTSEWSNPVHLVARRARLLLCTRAESCADAEEALQFGKRQLLMLCIAFRAAGVAANEVEQLRTLGERMLKLRLVVVEDGDDDADPAEPAGAEADFEVTRALTEQLSRLVAQFDATGGPVVEERVDDGASGSDCVRRGYSHLGFRLYCELVRTALDAEAGGWSSDGDDVMLALQCTRGVLGVSEQGERLASLVVSFEQYETSETPERALAHLCERVDAVVAHRRAPPARSEGSLAPADYPSLWLSRHQDEVLACVSAHLGGKLRDYRAYFSVNPAEMRMAVRAWRASVETLFSASRRETTVAAIEQRAGALIDASLSRQMRRLLQALDYECALEFAEAADNGAGVEAEVSRIRSEASVRLCRLAQATLDEYEVEPEFAGCFECCFRDPAGAHARAAAAMSREVGAVVRTASAHFATIEADGLAAIQSLTRLARVLRADSGPGALAEVREVCAGMCNGWCTQLEAVLKSSLERSLAAESWEAVAEGLVPKRSGSAVDAFTQIEQVCDVFLALALTEPPPPSSCARFMRLIDGHIAAYVDALVAGCPALPPSELQLGAPSPTPLSRQDALDRQLTAELCMRVSNCAWAATQVAPLESKLADALPTVDESERRLRLATDRCDVGCNALVCYVATKLVFYKLEPTLLTKLYMPSAAEGTRLAPVLSLLNPELRVVVNTLEERWCREVLHAVLGTLCFALGHIFESPARDFSMSHRDLIRADLAQLERFFLDGAILQQQMVKYSVSPLYAQAEAACGGTDLDGGAFAL